MRSMVNHIKIASFVYLPYYGVPWQTKCLNGQPGRTNKHGQLFNGKMLIKLNCYRNLITICTLGKGNELIPSPRGSQLHEFLSSPCDAAWSHVYIE